MHPTPTYIYINIRTFGNTRSQHKTTQPTSNSIPKHAYFIINFIYYNLTTNFTTWLILGQHNSNSIFHYTHSQHFSFGEYHHYLVLKLLELPKLGSLPCFFLFPNFQLKTHYTNTRKTYL